MLLRRLAFAALLSLAGVSVRAVPVEVGVDAATDGISFPNQTLLAGGVIEIGWLNPGTSQAQIQALAAAADFAGIDAVFNQVVVVPFPAGLDFDSGGGQYFRNVIVVANGDAAALAAYKNPATGAAGKDMYAWVRDSADPASTTQTAFIDGVGVFPTANDTLGFTDFATTIALSIPPVGTVAWVGSFASVVAGSQIDNSGAGNIAGDGLGATGSNHVLVVAAVATSATISFESGSTTALEGAGTVTLTVRRIGRADNTVSVQYSTVDASATAGVDYTARSGTLTFAPNDNSEEIVIPIADRAGFQGDRSFAVALSNPGNGAQLGSPATAAVTIQEDDAAMRGQIRLSNATYSVVENVASVAVTVQRVGGSDGAVSATLATANQSATAGQDFTAVSQSVSFGAGDAADRSVSIAILDDVTFEGNETFQVVLSAPTGGVALGSPAAAVVTIQDNEAAPSAGILSFAAGTASVGESGGLVTLTINRTNGSGGATSVQVNTGGGTATANAHYTPLINFPVNFSSGQTTATVQVQIANNNTFSGDRTFNVTLYNPTNGALLGNTATSVVTIVEDDAPRAGAFSFSSSTYSAPEAQGSATISVVRAGGAEVAASVSYSVTSGTATVGSDFEPATGTLSFGVNETSKTFNVAIVNDSASEPNETVNLALSAPTNGATLGPPNAAVLTIANDDLPATFRFSAASYPVVEGGPANVTVRRNGSLDLTLTVRLATRDGTARSATDYTATNATLTFAPNETEKSIAIGTREDALAEEAETFTANLQLVTSADPSVRLATPSAATVIIARSDAVDQPDVMAAAASNPRFAGDNVYNTTGSGQIASLSITSAGTAKFVIRVQNDGNLTDSFKVTGAASGTATGGSVRYLQDGRDVTYQMTSQDGLTLPNVAPRGRVDLQVEVRFKNGRQFTGYGAIVTASSINTPAKSDAARVLAIVR